MKFLRYGPRGAKRPEVLNDAGRIHDLTGLCCDIAGEVVTDLGQFARTDTATLPLVEDNPRLGPFVGGTGKFTCIDLKYADHAAEGNVEVRPELVLLMRATSSPCGPMIQSCCSAVRKRQIGKWKWAW